MKTKTNKWHWEEAQQELCTERWNEVTEMFEDMLREQSVSAPEPVMGVVPNQPMDETTTKNEKPPRAWRNREQDRRVVGLRRAAAASTIVPGETWFPWSERDDQVLSLLGFEKRSEEE